MITTPSTITLPDLGFLADEPAPVYCLYPGQNTLQPAYLEMDEDGCLTYDYSGEIGGAVPMAVWLNRTRRWAIPGDVRGAALADFLGLQNVQALLKRVHLGHEVRWDGNNHRGILDADAAEASEELGRLAESWFDEADRVNPMVPEAFLAGATTPRRLGEPESWDDATEFFIDDSPKFTITAVTTDKEIQAHADRLENQAEADNIYLDGSVAEHLEALRETCRENTPVVTLAQGFVTPPRYQGRIVDISYALSDDGEIIERTFDGSDRSETLVAYEDGEPESDFDPWNGVPKLGELIGPVRLA